MSNQVVGATLAPITDTTVAISYPSDDVVVIIRTVSLVVLLVLSLVGNVLVVLSVAQSSTNRHIPLNAFILSMASYGLLECALTMSLAIGFSIERTWRFGNFLAGFNASFVQLQNVGVMLTLVAMSVDRYIAVTRLTTYHTHSSVHRANYIVLYTWIHAFIFSLPLLFQNQMLGIVCRAFVERCLCGLVEGSSIAFTLLLGIVCFLIPLFLVVIFIILVSYNASKERKRVKSLNTAAYASYCKQESMVLNEARYSRYVGLLFFLYLIFKVPYVFVDILTQLNFSSVFEQITANNITITVDGTKFYYQTALSLMMFCFSAIFPVITFMQFPDHWRKTKSFLTCGHVSATSSNSRQRNAINQRNLRQKQRRQRHQQRRALEIARKRQQNLNMLHKAPSSVSSNITSEKVAINGVVSGEMFRVPVLYPATDGLHLVASDKTLQAKKKKSSAGSTSSTNNNNNLLDASASLSVSKSTMKSHISQPSGDVIDDVRPSSVVDKRVDVLGSRECLQIDEKEEVYISSDFDADEDTESELNTSANSRTLIWPNKQRAEGMRSVSMGDVLGESDKSAWCQREAASNKKTNTNSNIDPLRRSVLFDGRCESSTAFDSYRQEPPHPHTPTPPPDEDRDTNLSSALSYIDDDSEYSGENCVDKNNFSKIKLPTLKSKNIATVFTRTSNLSSRQEPLLSRSMGERFAGQSNEGYESPSALFSRRSSDASVVIKQISTFSDNRVHPNHVKAFYSESKDYAIHSTQLERTKTQQTALNDAMSGLVHANSQEQLNQEYLKRPRQQRPISGNHQILKVTPMAESQRLRPSTVRPKLKRAAPPIPDVGSVN